MSHYNFKHWLEILLSYDYLSGYTQLRCSGYSKDSTGKADLATDENSSFKARKEMIKGSRHHTIYTPLINDFLKSDNYLSPVNKLSITLTKAPDSFLLHCDESDTEQYKIEILDLKLFYNRVKVADSLLNKIIGKPERYLSTRTDLRYYPLAQNTSSQLITIANGTIFPKTLVCATLPTASFNGSYHTTPLVFPHYDVSRVRCYLRATSK